MLLNQEARNVCILATLSLLLTVGLRPELGQAGNPFEWLLPKTPSSPEVEQDHQRNVDIFAPNTNFLYQPSQNRVQNARLTQDLRRFQCVEPTRAAFDQYARQFGRVINNRTTEILDRLQMFQNTLRRTILLNKIILNDIQNVSQFQLRPELANYHYITPSYGNNWVLWYADIDDCELGIMKYTMFQILYLLDDNNLSAAYEKALNKSSHLPLMSSQGFQQISEILLVRLFDRFQGDSSMNKLFRWPLYVKKLASYAYNRIEAQQPNFKTKLGLVSFVYPSFFKDIKYNTPAVNRTQDNIASHEDHEKFNRLMGRKLASNKERNKRLVIFRQRATHLRLLSELPQASEQYWNLGSGAAQMSRLRRIEPRVPSHTHRGYVPPYDGFNNEGAPRNLPLIEEQLNQQQDSFKSSSEQWRSQFSDLTDEEFVAYLTQDFVMLDKDQIRFLEDNFPVKPLDQELRDEIARELLLRRTIEQHWVADSNERILEGTQPIAREQLKTKLAPFTLARQVVDELISDVGLPIGPTVVREIGENEHRSLFHRIGNMFHKIYGTFPSRDSSYPFDQPSYLPQPMENDMAEERVRRFDQFTENLGRFKAWWIKENWQWDNNDQQLIMLRLADMSWVEMKVILFKLCCLHPDELAQLAKHNVTLHYLASNSMLCQRLDNTEDLHNQGTVSDRLIDERQTINPIQVDDLVALEVYYYYSVHFNKHHSDPASFNASFSIFRSNVDQIRRHSCARSHTLYQALRLKRNDMLNTIDILDARRSYMDDLNLDRFKFFTLPHDSLYKISNQANNNFANNQDSNLGFDRIKAAKLTNHWNSMFAPLARDQRRMLSVQRESASRPSHLDLLLGENHEYVLNSRNYNQLQAQHIYDIVKYNYQICNQLSGRELSQADLARKRCDGSRGSLADQSVLSTFTNNDASWTGSKNSCDWYWSGLTHYEQNLIKQSPELREAIESAKCN